MRKRLTLRLASLSLGLVVVLAATACSSSPPTAPVDVVSKSGSVAGQATPPLRYRMTPYARMTPYPGAGMGQMGDMAREMARDMRRMHQTAQPMTQEELQNMTGLMADMMDEMSNIMMKMGQFESRLSPTERQELASEMEGLWYTMQEMQRVMPAVTPSPFEATPSPRLTSTPSPVPTQTPAPMPMMPMETPTPTP